MIRKFIRLDETHFALLLKDGEFTQSRVSQLTDSWKTWWPETKLMILTADEFIAQPGQYEVVKLADD